MLTKLISPFLLLAFLSGCTNIAPQDISVEIQKTNNVGELIFSSSVVFFESDLLDKWTGSPNEGYFSLFSNGMAISHYGGRKLINKVFYSKDINLISFENGQVDEYYRPKFLTVSWTSNSKVNQFAFKVGKNYYAVRLSEGDFIKTQSFFNNLDVQKLNIGLVKRIRTNYDAAMEAYENPNVFIPPSKR